MNELLAKKKELEKQLVEINELIEKENQKQLLEKESKKEVKYFEEGKTYDVFYRTKGMQVFTCTHADKKKLTVKGYIGNNSEKFFVATPVWDSIKQKNDGLPPSAYSIIVDKRSKMACISK